MKFIFWVPAVWAGLGTYSLSHQMGWPTYIELTGFAIAMTALTRQLIHFRYIVAQWWKEAK